MRIISDVVIFDLAGRFSSMEFKLHERAKQVMNAGCRAFIFNMTDVSYIDSFAVGQMFSIWTSMQSKEGHIVLLRPTQAVRTVLETTKLDTIFPIFTDEAQAVAQLRQAARAR